MMPIYRAAVSCSLRGCFAPAFAGVAVSFGLSGQ
jgi:hypothetical protein